MKKKLCIAGVLILLIPVLAGAQALPFVVAEYDAASLGKAGAALVSNTNVAAIPFSDSKMDVVAGYTMWTPSNSNILNARASYKVGKKLGVSADLIYGMYPSYDMTGEGGSVIGSYSPSDMHVKAGVSYKILPFLSAGAKVGYAMSSLSDKYSYGALTADVFAMASLSDLKVTLGVANLGSSVTSASGAKFSLPTSLALGAGYGKTFAEKHRVDVSLDADYFFSGDVAVAAGVEYAMNDLAFVRAGYRVGGDSVLPSFASVGAGVKFMGIKLDVAYLIGSENMRNTLAIGAGFTF